MPSTWMVSKLPHLSAFFRDILFGCHTPSLVALRTVAGNIYLALGYMDGGSLEALMTRYLPVAKGARLEIHGLPEQVIGHVMLQVCALSVGRAIAKTLRGANSSKQGSCRCGQVERGISSHVL